MPPMIGARELAPRAWSTATWTAPLMIQLVIGVGILISWWLGRVSDLYGVSLILATAAIITSVCAVAGWLLLRSQSSRAHGLAVSMTGSVVVAFIGVMIFALWLFRW